MCGICGIVDFGDVLDRKLIQDMTQQLYHRGPDERGYFFSSYGPSVGLGHRRLSIIDLDLGKQPMSNEESNIWTVFNGEIYNFQMLKNDLVEKGHKFATKSDTEVILHAYEQWGEEFVEKLRGMFAFAIWDEREHKLLIVRDRLGIKPVYFYVCGSKIVFASELKGILVDPDVPREIDFSSLFDYLSLLYIPAPKTIFKHIYKLPPAHMLVFSDGDVRIKEYWDLEFIPSCSYESEKGLMDELLDIFKESVDMRLISDVPLGAFLSGGVDSSSVVALMSLSKGEVITNSIGFKEKSYDELSYARKVAKLFNTNHHEYVVTSDAADIIDKLVFYYDEPFADSSAIPTYYVSKIARQNMTVALSGDGGDENFAGYRRYFFDRLESFLRNILPDSVRNIIAPIADIYPKGDWLPQIFRGKTFLKNLTIPHSEAYFRSVSQISPELKLALISEDFKNELKGYDTLDLFKKYFKKASHVTSDSLSMVQYVDFKTYLVDDILTKVDRASMANSLEVRVPILDHKFVEFIAHIPSSLKLKGRTSKYIFKKAMSRFLPKDILHRKKRGFVMPVAKWFRSELKQEAKRTILGDGFIKKGFFNHSLIEKLWKEHQSGISDHSPILWSLFVFEKWFDKWLN